MIEPIRVLHVVGGMVSGGQETFIMNIYRNINRELVQFDFVVHTKERCFYDDEIEQLGGRIFRLTSKKESLIKNLFQMHHLLKMHKEYKIIHIHTNTITSSINLFLAKINGVNVRIAHSHSTKSAFNKIHFLGQPILNFLSTDKFACSEEAGRWLYGKNENFKNINNAIDSEKYQFSPKEREKKQNELNISNKFIIGHIGRFSYPKNHDFLIEVFQKIYKQNSNAILMLIGTGELEQKIKEKVYSLGLDKVVMFMGVRSDIPGLLQAMDVFLFPSRFEGLPVSIIEAQASGIKCFISNNITRQVEITKLIEYISLEMPAKYWADRVLKTGNEYERGRTTEDIIQAGFDVNSVSRYFKEYYLERYNS